MALQAPAGGGGGPLQQLGNLIRYWVHYDNVLQRLNKEAKEARDHRKNYETQILQGIREAKLANPVIQITGGRILVSEERNTAPLSLKSLELLLHQYHRMKPGRPDETKDIMNFVKANRTVEVAETLKRIQNPGQG
jgi:hypothetical protein